MACPIGEDVALSSRRCAGARFLFDSIVHDPLAPILAGDDIIVSERINKENNAVYPVVAIRTHWMDEKIKALLAADPGITQVVLCGAGMDARAYRMEALKQCEVYELDIKPVLDYKASTISTVTDKFPLLAASIKRVDSDFADDISWMDKLKASGYSPTKGKTIWILEGFLYYFEKERAHSLLKTVQKDSVAGSVLLADHINDFTLVSLKKQAANKWLASTFSSSMEVPEEELPLLGFEGVEVVTVGEEKANYGVWSLPMVPRGESKEVMRTYLFEARVK